MALALAATVAGMTLPACPTGCTDRGWTEGLTIRLDDMRFANGAYLIDVVADGVTIAIDLDVVDGKASCAGCQFEVIRADQLAVIAMFIGGGTTGGDSVYFSSLLVSLRDSANQKAGGPSTVTVTIYREASEIATRTFRPQYRREEINGPGCGWATTAEVNWD